MNSTNRAMDLKEFDFPDVSKADMAFPTFRALPELKKEAEARGYDMNSTPKFDQIFYSGGRVVMKEGVDPEYRQKVYMYVRAFMGSFQPKHEDKAIIAEMLWDEIIERVDPIDDDGY